MGHAYHNHGEQPAQKGEMNAPVTQQDFFRLFGGLIRIGAGAALGLLGVAKQLVAEDPHQDKRHA